MPKKGLTAEEQKLVADFKKPVIVLPPGPARADGLKPQPWKEQIRVWNSQLKGRREFYSKMNRISTVHRREIEFLHKQGETPEEIATRVKLPLAQIDYVLTGGNRKNET